MITDNVITTSAGGAGGEGGDGGSGMRIGTGGLSVYMVGANGGPEVTGAHAGGKGGNGGRGGDGGHGGGGGGGPSIGIAFQEPPTMSGNVITIGSGGPGGASAGNPGQTGQSAQTRNF